MTTDIETILDGWLGEGTDILLDSSIEAVLRTVGRTSQRGSIRIRWWGSTRRDQQRMVMAGAAVVVALVAGGLMLSGGLQSPSVGNPTQPTASATPSAVPAPTGRIVFVKGGPETPGHLHDTNDDIWVMNADGSGATQLTSWASPESNPVWSPDATRIAFLVGDAAAQIWLMDADGSDPRQLTHNPFPLGRPTWSPDGSRIAFALNEGITADAQHGGLYVMNADGSGQRRITTDTNDRSPAWSPDGDRIAFANGGSVFTVLPDGSARTLYASNADPSMRVVSVSWAPDASRIAVGEASDDAVIWLESDSSVGNPRISAPVRLASPPTLFAVSRPTWSRDGQWIAFAADVDTSGSGLYDGADHVADILVVRPDGSGLLDLTNDKAPDNDPNWSWGR